MSDKKWTDELLNRMRLTGDPIADKAAKVLWENQNSRAIIEELKLISKDHNLVTYGKAKELQEYFQVTETVNVTQEEIEKFKISANIFNNYGFRLCGLLFFKALPTGYTCPKPGRMTVKDAPGPGSLKPGNSERNRCSPRT